MATYIVLFNFTAQGMQNIKGSPKRIDILKKTLRDVGVELKKFYSVMGRYDTVCIFEAPDDKTMAKAVLAMGLAGNVRTETLRAFTEDEFKEIINELS